jgi:hypothetical protein
MFNTIALCQIQGYGILFSGIDCGSAPDGKTLQPEAGFDLPKCLPLLCLVHQAKQYTRLALATETGTIRKPIL